jgi:hypothetical protein
MAPSNPVSKLRTLLAILALASALVALVPATVSAAPADAAARGGSTRYYLSASAPLSGMPYRLGVVVSANRGEDPTVTIELADERSTGTRYSSFQADGGSLRCTRRLTSCRLDTGDAFGPVGGLALTFTATRPATTTTSTCEATGEITGRQQIRLGALSGSFSVDTGTGLFATIGTDGGQTGLDEPLSGSISRIVDTGVDCPSDSGGGECGRPELSLTVFEFDTTSTYISVSRPVRRGGAQVYVSHTAEAPAAGVELRHVLLLHAPRGAFRVGSATRLGAATVRFDGLADGVGGTVTFAATEPLAPGTGSCESSSRSGRVTADMAVEFAGFGTVVFDGGPGVTATLARRT